MRVDTTGLYPSRSTSKAASETAPRPPAQSPRAVGSDNVTVSSQARLLALGKTALGSAPELRTSVIDVAREKLSSTPNVYDGDEIARAIIDSITEGSQPRGRRVE